MTSFLQLPLAYFLWHYTAAWGDLFRLYANFAWFLWHFFSISLLVSTLFSPWKRLRETGRGGGGFFAHLIINTVTRVVGFFVRTVTLFVGFLALGLLAILGAAAAALWVSLPLAALWLIVRGGIGVVGFFAV